MKKILIITTTVVILSLLASYFLMHSLRSKDTNKEGCASILMSNSKETASSNLSTFGKFLEADGQIFFALKFTDNISTGIYSSNAAGDKIKKISDLSVMNLQSYDDHLYAENEGKIVRMNYDGSKLQGLVAGTEFDLDQSTGNIYYSDYNQWDGIWCLYPSGNQEKIYHEFGTSFQVQGDYLYFINESNLSLSRFHLLDKTVEKLSNDSIASYTYVGDEVYFINGSMYKINLSSLETSLIKEGKLQSFSINNDWIYFTENSEGDNKVGNIKKMKMDGTCETLLHQGGFDPFEEWLHVGGDWLYLAKAFYSHELKRLGPNGGPLEIMVMPILNES